MFAARVFAFTALFVLSTTTASSSPAPMIGAEGSAIEWSVEPTEACCKICKKGKACGDSCIARDKECHQPPGCACDG
jgi:hypothetical protein